MPLDRTWYNALVDDDGTGTNGSVWDRTAVDALMDAVDAAIPIDGAAATASLRTLGITATSAAAGNDARLSNARTPTAHAASHKSGGSDAIKLDELAAPTDVTTLNVSTTAHGLAPKLTGDLTSFLRADGLWAAVNPAVIGITALGGYAGGTATYLRADATFATPKLDDLAAPDDNTDLNVSTAAHGLAPKLPNDATKFLNGVGAYAVPPTTPAAHHTSHEFGGSDVIKLDDLGTPDDNTDLDASTTRHGLLKKLPGGSSSYLRGDGVFATPPGGGGSGTVTGPATSVVGRVATWADAFGTVLADGGVALASLVVTGDTRLSDARTPTAHTHPESDVTNLVTDLAARKLTDQGTSNTGTQNNFNLGARMTYLRCDGAAPVFTGFTVLGSAPAAGDLVVLHNTGTGTLRVAKNAGGSTAANQINSPSARGQIVGADGSITLVYDGAASRWRVDGVQCGTPVPVAFNAANFTGGGSSTWSVDSGDVVANAFLQEGTKVTWFISVSTSTLGGIANNALNVALPNGFTVANNGIQVGPAGRYLDTGSTFFSAIFVANNATPTVLTIGSLSGANLAAGTNTFYLQGMALFLVD